NLTRLFRFAKLPKIFHISIREFVHLFDLINIDINEVQNIENSFENFNKLVKLYHKLKDIDLNILELHYIATEALNPYVKPGFVDQDGIILVNDITQLLHIYPIKREDFEIIENTTDEEMETIITWLQDNNIIIGKAEDEWELTDNYDPEKPLPLPSDVSKYENDVKQILNKFDLRQILLNKLAQFYSVEPLILKQTISLAGYNIKDLVDMFSQQNDVKKVSDIQQSLLEILRAIHAKIAFVKKIGLNAKDIEVIYEHKDLFGIENPHKL
ncbi:unnamed protein product, partial [marine sediment metagenome]